MADQRDARRVMVDNQIRTFDVTDRAVIAAFESVPREVFVAARDRGIAYSDRMLSVGEGAASRMLLVPLVLARLIQALQPVAGERALDVLGGTGYSAAILAAANLDVTVAETDAALIEAARKACGEAGVTVSFAAIGAISAAGGAEAATGTFDIILINGATEREPSGFYPLLSEAGRLGIIQRTGNAARALVYHKSGGNVSPRRAFDCQAPVLPGFAAAAGFVF